jgi:hypothetical protein
MGERVEALPQRLDTRKEKKMSEQFEGVRVVRADSVDEGELTPRVKKSWQKVNEAVRGMKPGDVAEFDYPEDATVEQRRELRMVVGVACRRFHGPRKYHIKQSQDKRKLRAYLK